MTADAQRMRVCGARPFTGPPGSEHGRPHPLPDLRAHGLGGSLGGRRVCWRYDIIGVRGSGEPLRGPVRHGRHLGRTAGRGQERPPGGRIGTYSVPTRRLRSATCCAISAAPSWTRSTGRRAAQALRAGPRAALSLHQGRADRVLPAPPWSARRCASCRRVARSRVRTVAAHRRPVLGGRERLRGHPLAVPERDAAADRRSAASAAGPPPLREDHRRLLLQRHRLRRAPRRVARVPLSGALGRRPHDVQELLLVGIGGAAGCRTRSASTPRSSCAATADRSDRPQRHGRAASATRGPPAAGRRTRRSGSPRRCPPPRPRPG